MLSTTPAAKCRGSVESSVKSNETGIRVGHLIVRRNGQTEAGAKIEVICGKGE